MDYSVIWSPEAIDDIESIAEFIRTSSPAFASIIVERILSLPPVLCEHPYSCRSVPELHNTLIREKLLCSYRIIYEIQNSKIVILAVIHQNRMLDAVEDRFE